MKNKNIFLIIIISLLVIPAFVSARTVESTVSHQIKIDLPEIGENPPWAVDDEYYTITGQSWFNKTDNVYMTNDDVFEENKFYHYSINYNILMFNTNSNLDHFLNSPYSLDGGGTAGDTSGSAGWDFYMGNKDNLNANTNDFIIPENQQIIANGKLKTPSINKNNEKISDYQLSWYNEDESYILTYPDVEKGNVYKLKIIIYPKYFIDSNFQVINNNKGETDDYKFISDSTTVSEGSAIYEAYYQAKRANHANINFINTNNDYVYTLKVPLNMNVNLNPSELNNPSMYSGYKLLGWNTKADGSGDFYSVDDYINLDDNIDLYTVWSNEKVRLKVTFKCSPSDISCIGSPVIYDEEYNSLENVAIPGEDKFIKNNYKLIKWKKSNKYSDPYLKPDTEEKMTSFIENPIYDYEVDYYAYFLNNYKTITLYANNESDDYKELYFETGDEVCLSSDFTKTGYDLRGWSLTLNGSKDYYSSCYHFSKSTPLYAIWEPITYSIWYSSVGGSGSMPIQYFKYDEEQALNTNTYTKNGYKFSKWNTKSDGTGTDYEDGQVVNNLTSKSYDRIYLYAQWEPNKYYIHFNPNGGEGEMEDQMFSYYERGNLNPNIFIKTGYRFDHWSYGNKWYSDNSEIYNLSSVDGTIIEFVAQWKPISYSIIYNSNDGDWWYPRDLSNLKYDEEYTLVANPFYKRGYNFIGWNTESDGTGTSYSNEQVVKNLSSVDKSTATLYAQWEPVNYSVSFNPNSGEGTMEDQSFTWDAEQELSSNTFTKTGYIFDYWSDVPDGSGSRYSDKQSVKNISSSLYAQWKPINYEILYNSNEGIGEMDNQSMTYDVSDNLTKNSFTRKGYNFIGWNTKSDGTGTNYSDEQNILNLTTTNNEIIKLYAQWKKINSIPVYRMYNPRTGEHLYTTDTNEVEIIYRTQGWGKEGIGWYTTDEGIPVYRLYSPKFDNHLYTSDQNEMNIITSKYGWVFDNVRNGVPQPVMYSKGDTEIYRLYNPAQNDQHHLTTDKNEYDIIPKWGWRQEGVAMKAIEIGKPEITHYYK